ncbi:MAG TPA: 3-oxoacyl-[acyl-carrier-protein] reductase [Negativicutes bacterium]|nr:3-oxoacyl-[acyl-carrier-protein] reductase [Negativicutes bacterium]
MRLKDKVAIVTGSTKGIGLETAKTFAREGAKVVICGTRENAINEVVEEIKATGAEALGFKVDVSNRASVNEMVAAVKSAWGRIDILVNNAGITADAMLKKMTEDQFDRVINTNMKGVFNCAQAVLDTMTEQGSGVILNATSVVGLYGNVGQTNYAAAKWGVIGMTKTWAKELGRKGIRVNAVAPGFIKTPMTDAVPEKVLEMMKEKAPLQRLGEPEDIANAYLFLASDEASFITGTVLSVDGGLVIG